MLNGKLYLLKSYRATERSRRITEHDYRIGHVGLVTYQMNGNDDMFSFDYSPYYHKDDFELIVESKDVNADLSIHKTEHLIILKHAHSPFNICMNKDTSKLLKEYL